MNDGTFRSFKLSMRRPVAGPKWFGFDTCVRTGTALAAAKGLVELLFSRPLLEKRLQQRIKLVWSGAQSIRFPLLFFKLPISLLSLPHEEQTDIEPFNFGLQSLRDLVAGTPTLSGCYLPRRRARRCAPTTLCSVNYGLFSIN